MEPYLVVTVSGDNSLYLEGAYTDQFEAEAAASGTGGYIVRTAQAWGWHV